MKKSPEIFAELDLRRRELGMSVLVLAEKSGVSHPTAKRILSGRHPHATWSNVSTLAKVLGMTIELGSVVEPEELREQQARRKAELLVKMVQGTSALEGQAVDKKKYEQMLRRTVHELLAGPVRKLWAE